MRCARLAAGRYRWVAPVVVGILLAAAPAYAQQKRDNGEFTTPPLLGTDRERLQKLREGQPLGEADKEVLDRAAKYFVYRLTDRKHQFPPPGAGSKQGMYELIQELFQHFPDLKKTSTNSTKAQNQQQYVKEFSNRLAAYVLKLLGSSDMIARVNGVILLARLGETGQEDLVDPMCKIIEDKNQGDAVKLHALRGLRNLFDNRHEDAFRGDAGEDRLVHCLRTLTDFLNRQPAKGTTATEAQREAFQYVRREAVRALGAARVPVIVKKRVKVSIPALQLLRVAAGAGLEPPPSLTEQVEAAAGLCRMQLKNVDKYQPEVAAYAIGRVVVDFATQYDKDRSSQPALEYKYYAFLLDGALTELQTQTGSKIRFVNDMITKARPVLKAILTDGAPAQLPLKEWLDNNSWEGKELFKGDAETALKGSVLKATAPPAPAK